MRKAIGSMLRLVLAGGVGCVAMVGAMAQAFPTRPVTIVNPYPPGGGADVVVRALAKELSQEWQQPVIVENKPGAGTTIGAAFVARAPADGSTLLMSTSQHAIAPALFKSLPYSYLTSFAPITMLASAPFLLVVRPDQRLKDINDVLTQLRQRGSEMNYASAGPGSLPHLAGVLMNQLAGGSAVHIAYAGTAPALTALLGGQVDYMFADSSALPLVQGGKLRALAVTSSGRLGSLPEVPAMAESLRGFELTVWSALEAPAGTPRPVIERIHASVAKALQTPAVIRMFAENSRNVVSMTPEEFATFKAAEILKYQKVAREAGLQLE
jgi:tripartite-type tricarboxylate transporter receptor subunit TctC